MPTSLGTPQTLPLGYTDAATLGPIQNLEKVVFQVTGGVVVFQVGRLDPTGKPVFDQTEAALPPGIWGFDQIYGIRFRSRDVASLATLDPCTGYFDDDPDPYNPGTIPGSTTAVTGALNFQHNDGLVASQPTADFEDSAGGTFLWGVTNDAPGNRVRVTPPDVVTSVFGRNGTVVAQTGDYVAAQVTNAADKSSVSAQVFSGSVSTGPASNAIGQTSPGVWNETSGRVLVWRSANSSPTIGMTIVGDTVWRLAIDANGSHAWSSGAAVSDLNMGRAVLNTVPSLQVGPSGSGISNGGVPNLLTSTGWVVWSGVQSTITSAAGNNVFVSGVLNDATYRHLVDGNGKHSWGPGSGAVDTNLYRSAAGVLTSDGIIIAGNGFETIQATNLNVISNFLLATDTQPSFKIFAQGAMEWGVGGSTAPDIELARIVSGASGTGSFLEIINGDGFGYGTGTGHAVTQLTSKTTTTPACNFPTGKVTLANSTLNSGQIADFTVPCSVYGVEDTVIVTQVSNSGISTYQIWPVADGIGPTAGNMRFAIQNIGTISEGAVISFQYTIIKGAIS